jgi:hypothetical protein
MGLPVGAPSPGEAAPRLAPAGPGDPFRPLCEAGIDSPGSTCLKWGDDGDLTAQDLHHVLARLLACDPEALQMLDADVSL